MSSHKRTTTASAAMSAAYGTSVAVKHDPVYKLATRMHNYEAKHIDDLRNVLTKFVTTGTVPEEFTYSKGFGLCSYVLLTCVHINSANLFKDCLHSMFAYKGSTTSFTYPINNKRSKFIDRVQFRRCNLYKGKQLRLRIKLAKDVLTLLSQVQSL